MERVAVKSSHLKAVGYDRDSGILEVEFKNGDVYQYLDVPLKIFVALCQARSKGKYMHRHIRGKYRHQKVEEDAS